MKYVQYLKIYDNIIISDRDNKYDVIYLICYYPHNAKLHSILLRIAKHMFAYPFLFYVSNLVQLFII